MPMIFEKRYDGLVTDARIAEDMWTLLERLPGTPRRVLLLPPDYTRMHSGSGSICRILYELLAPECKVDIMPAIGTHVPMTEREIRKMFGDKIPFVSFLDHDWRNALVTLGEVPAPLVREWSEGKLDFPIPIQVNRRLLEGKYDLILSVGQVVPHEVVGMANFTKNICVGIGGQSTINRSHYLGAVYGMERIMGRQDTPVRRVLNYGVQTFLKGLPLHFIMTVMAKDKASGEVRMRGLFAGDEEAFTAACGLSQKLNLDLLERPLNKVVVYLEPGEFRSTWLGNKSIYRTRMAIADGGELVVLAPALREFGEDPEIDRLIRKYGYRGTNATLEAVRENKELTNNLSAAAHLIHGSSNGRFRITYCPGPGMALDAMRNVGFDAAPFAEMARRYPPDTLKDGFNTLPDGEEIFFISNPGLGLWALKSAFS